MPHPIEILHVAYTHLPADTRVKRELEALRATGRRLGVICVRARGEAAVERWNGITVVRVPGRKSRGGAASYFAEYGDFVWRARRLIARHRAFGQLRVVHVHTLPDFLMWAALPARRRGARVVFDMHEIFPEFIRAKYSGVLGRLGARFAGWIERRAREYADLTIIVNEPIDRLLAARPTASPEHRLIVHNTADPADFGQPAAPPSHSQGTPLELIYHGTVTPLYGLETAIRGVALVRGGGLDARLTILGSGPDVGRLQEIAKALDLLEAVRLDPPINQAALPFRLRRCVAGLVPTHLNGMTQYSLSTKLLEYVHLGMPVLAARLPSYLHYLPENTLWYWAPGDADDLARAIRALAAAPAVELTRRARLAQSAIARFAWLNESARLVEAYAELLAPSTASDRTAAMRPAPRPS